MTDTTGGSPTMRPTRVLLDLNQVARGEAPYYLARFWDAAAPVEKEQIVQVVKRSEHEDEPDLVAFARVADIDRDYQLIYLGDYSATIHEDDRWVSDRPWFEHGRALYESAPAGGASGGPATRGETEPEIVAIPGAATWPGAE